MQYALAVDIGGTKATVASIDGAFKVLHRREISTGSASNLDEALIEASKEVIAATSGELIGVGIGSAGPLNLTKGTISPVNIPSWRGFEIVENYKKLTDCKNVVLHGDGMAVADAEHQLGDRNAGEIKRLRRLFVEPVADRRIRLRFHCLGDNIGVEQDHQKRSGSAGVLSRV